MTSWKFLKGFHLVLSAVKKGDNSIIKKFQYRNFLLPCWASSTRVNFQVRRGEPRYLQHGGQNPLVAAEREEVVEMHSAVDDSGSVLPEQGTVLRVKNQSPIKNVEEKHDFITPGKLARHAQEHLLQELDPQAFLKSVEAKQLLPSCKNMIWQRQS